MSLSIVVIGIEPLPTDDEQKREQEKNGQKMMSWKTINTILGHAATDDAFCENLLKSPVKAIKQKGFDLTKEEEELLNNISASDLSEFSQRVLVLFGREE